MKYEDIKQFIPGGNYCVDVGWDYLTSWMKNQQDYTTVDLDPDFQRGHVWDTQKKQDYVEYVLRGGQSSRDIWWNCAGWQTKDFKHPLVLVDGKQRLTAVTDFLTNNLKVFGSLRSEFTDRIRMAGPSFRVHVNNLQSRAEVLQWYLEMNAGGVVHTKEELDKVRVLLKKETSQPND